MSDYKNPFDKHRNSGGKKEFTPRPWNIELRWAVGDGVFKFTERDKDGKVFRKGHMKNLSGVVLDSGMFQIQGSGAKGRVRLYSTVAKRFEHDEFKLFMKDYRKENSKAEKIFEGIYSDLKREPFPQDVPAREWNKVIFVHLIQASVAVESEKTNKVGSFGKKPEKFDALVKITMKGGSAIVGWGDQAKEQGFPYDENLMGVGFRQSENGSSPGNKFLDKFYHPTWSFSQLQFDSDKESVAKAARGLLDEAAETHAALREYLASEWGEDWNVDQTIQDDDFDDSKEPGMQKVGSQEEEEEDPVGVDDDLPF